MAIPYLASDPMIDALMGESLPGSAPGELTHSGYEDPYTADLIKRSTEPAIFDIVRRAAAAGTRQKDATGALERALLQRAQAEQGIPAAMGTNAVPTPFGTILQRKSPFEKLLALGDLGVGAYRGYRAGKEKSAADAEVDRLRVDYAGSALRGGPTVEEALANQETAGLAGLAAPVLAPQGKAYADNAIRKQVGLLRFSMAQQRAKIQAEHDAADRAAAEARLAAQNAREDAYRKEQQAQRDLDRKNALNAARIAAGQKEKADDKKEGGDLAKEAAAYAKNVEPVIAGYRNYKALYRIIEENPAAAEAFMRAEREQAIKEKSLGGLVQMVLGGSKDVSQRALESIPAGPQRDAAARYFNARLLAAEYLGRKQSGGAITKEELENFEQLVAGSNSAADAMRRIRSLSETATLGALEQGRPYRKQYGEAFSVPEAYADWEALASGGNPLSGRRAVPAAAPADEKPPRPGAIRTKSGRWAIQNAQGVWEYL